MWQFVNLREKIPILDVVLSSHGLEKNFTFAFDKNCVESELQKDWDYHADLKQTYLVFKLQVVKSRSYATYNIKEIENEHEKEAEADKNSREEEEAPVSLVTRVNNTLHSFYSNVEVYINSQQIYKSKGLDSHKSYISNTFQEAILKTREFCTARVTTRNNFQ